MLHGTKYSSGNETSGVLPDIVAGAPAKASGLTPWATAFSAIPGTLTAGSQLWSGYWAKSGRGAELQGNANLAQARANQTSADAALITAKSNAQSAAGALDTNTLMLVGGGLLLATFLLIRRKK